MSDSEMAAAMAAEAARVRELTLAHAREIPKELQALRQWAPYILRPRDGGKWGKPPATLKGDLLKWTDPRNLFTFDQALDALRKGAAARLAGIGMVFTGEEPYSGVDLDDCIQDGALTAQARQIVDALDSYTEISPSGRGLRIICRGKLLSGDPGGRRGPYEVYSAGRFLTMTGRVFEGRRTIEKRTDALREFRATYASAPAAPPSRGCQTPPPPTGPLTDDEILALIDRAANGDKVRALMAGGGGSEGDAALIWELAFYTRDPAQIERIMRSTARVRPKWDEPRAGEPFLRYEIRRCLERYRGGHYTPRVTSGQAGQTDGWDDPVCYRERLAPPPFPSDQLPAALRGYVESVAACRQVPVDLPALLAIAVAAAAGARRYRVYIGDSHSVPVNIWVAVGLPSGSRKSDTFADMVRPLTLEQARLYAEMKPIIEEARAKHGLHEQRKKRLLRQIEREERQERQAALERELIELERQQVVVPPYPCLVVSGDTTPEAAAALLEEQGGRIALMDTEGGLFSLMAGRYDRGGQPNLDVWLKMHKGDDLSVHRRGSPPIVVPCPAGTVALTVQPSVIRDLAAQRAFHERGLLARFLYALPRSLVGTRLYEDRRVDEAAEAAYIAAIRRIYSQPEARPEPGDQAPPHHRLHIRGEALEIWRAFHDDVERRQADGGDLEGMRDWASKAAEAVARLAGILHLVETGGDPTQDEIPWETMGRAYEIGRLHLIDHAKMAYGLMTMGAAECLARDIMAWIVEKKRAVFTPRDFWVDHRSKVSSSEELLPALAILEDRGVVRETPTEGGRGRRAKHRYTVNPRCLSCKGGCMADD